MKLQKLRNVICALIGHSHIVTNCIGYKYCARCGQQVGDTLAGCGLPTGKGGYFLLNQTCACDDCKAAFDSLTWKDKLLVKKPMFPKKK